MSMAALLASAFLAAQAPAPELLGQWQAFRVRFVTDEGRVRDTGNEGVSHSEGQAYAMLAAASLGQRADFDRLWKWTTANLGTRGDGLLAWRWDPETGTVADANNATDGDLVAAWALLRAARRWPTGGYQRDAARLLDAIEAHVVAGSRMGPVLQPGVDGFRAADGLVVNPSYWVFPALEEIALARPAGPWRRIAGAGRKLLGEARFGPAGLPSDWVLLSRPVVPAPDRPPRFGYDALRIPLYACWSGATDLAVLDAVRRAWRSPAPPAWIDLASGETASWSLGPGGMAVRALLDRCLGGEARIPPPGDTPDYYDAILALLSAIAAREVAW